MISCRGGTGIGATPARPSLWAGRRPRPWSCTASARERLSRVLDAVRPGVVAADLDELARSGLDYPHHSGHGLGADWHEEPRIVPGARTVLEPGMVVAFEPGSYGDARRSSGRAGRAGDHGRLRGPLRARARALSCKSLTLRRPRPRAKDDALGKKEERMRGRRGWLRHSSGLASWRQSRPERDSSRAASLGEHG